LLIEEAGLWAVASLPSGVFNPYAGVKTSVLLFDKALVKKAKHILFVKIENDGFDLGAKRRPVIGTELPMAVEALNSYKQFLQQNRQTDDSGWPNIAEVDTNPLCNFVSKQNIEDNGDYNLSGERYKEDSNLTNQRWPMVELGEVLSYEQPTKYIVSSVDYDDSYSTPVLTAGKTFILGHTDEKTGIFQEKLPVIIFDDFTTATKLVDFPFKVKSSAIKILHANDNKTNIKFLFYVMQKITFSVNEHKRYWISQYSKIKIPLPPIEVQNDIVQKIEIKQQAILHAKALIVTLERERELILTQTLEPKRKAGQS
jgi:hypothetical protein